MNPFKFAESEPIIRGCARRLNLLASALIELIMKLSSTARDNIENQNLYIFFGVFEIYVISY
jgi:hypothetical protein